MKTISLRDFIGIFKKRSTQQFVGIRKIYDDYIHISIGDSLFYYAIEPSNISVLPIELVYQLVARLAILIKMVGEMEFLSIDTAENFRYNLSFLHDRLEEETDISVKRLLQEEIQELDKIKQEVATSKQFLIIFRFRIKDKKQIDSTIRQLEKNMKDNMFHYKKLEKEELKRMLAIYFEQNVSSDTYYDYDGENLVEARVLRSNTGTELLLDYASKVGDIIEK